jgi:hypothetical protein
MHYDEEKIRQPYKRSRFAGDIPAFPSTPHLPYKPNMAVGDFAASESDAASLFASDEVYIFEKVDGANCAVMLDDDGEFLVRNKDHILKKGFLKKETPAKMQFRRLWNWVRFMPFDLYINGEFVEPNLADRVLRASQISLGFLERCEDEN